MTLLLETGANVNEQSEAHSNSPEIAAAQGGVDIDEILIESGASVN